MKPETRDMRRGTICIENRDDADRCLQRIGQLERFLEDAENDAEADIERVRVTLLKETAIQRDALDANKKALEEWTKMDAKSWGKEKHLELNWGTVGLRLPPPAIKLKLAVETIIERLRANKMFTCIRTIKEVDKEALANYDDETLVEVGCARTKPKDKFWYETKKEEVK